MAEPHSAPVASTRGEAPKIGVFDATMLVMGGIVVLKIAAIVSLIGCGIGVLARGAGSTSSMSGHVTEHPWIALGAALTPVMFAYGGWQTASFAAADMRDPARDLSRAMLYGVLGVFALYLAVNAALLLVPLARTGSPPP